MSKTANTILRFSCPVLEQDVRKQLNRPSGDISPEDVLVIKRVDASTYNFRYEDFEPLCAFKNLESLSIYAGDTSLDFLSNFPHMKEVEVECYDHCRSFLDFTPLAGLKDLEYLMVSSGDMPDKSFENTEVLATLPKLKDISFHDFDCVDLKFLEKMPWLSHLFVGYGNHVDNIASIGSISGLDWLQLYDLEFDNLDFLDTISDDMSLELCGCEIREGFNMNALARFKDLDVSDMTVNGEWIKGNSDSD